MALAQTRQTKTAAQRFLASLSPISYFFTEIWFPAMWRCARGGFRRVEFEFEVKNDEEQAPEVKNKEKAKPLNFEINYSV